MHTVCYFIAWVSLKEQNAPSMFGEFGASDSDTPSVFTPVKPNSTARFMLNNIASRWLNKMTTERGGKALKTRYVEAYASVGLRTISYKPGNQKYLAACRLELYAHVLLLIVSLKSIWFISFIQRS